MTNPKGCVPAKIKNNNFITMKVSDFPEGAILGDIVVITGYVLAIKGRVVYLGGLDVYAGEDAVRKVAINS